MLANGGQQISILVWHIPGQVFLPLVLCAARLTCLFPDYYSRVYLSDHSPSKIAYVMTFLCAHITGSVSKQLDREPAAYNAVRSRHCIREAVRRWAFLSARNHGLNPLHGVVSVNVPFIPSKFDRGC